MATAVLLRGYPKFGCELCCRQPAKDLTSQPACEAWLLSTNWRTCSCRSARSSDKTSVTCGVCMRYEEGVEAVLLPPGLAAIFNTATA